MKTLRRYQQLSAHAAATSRQSNNGKPARGMAAVALLCAFVGPALLGHSNASGAARPKNVVAARFAGPDCGAKVNAADASVYSVPATIVVSQACGTTWTTRIRLAVNHSLVFAQSGTYSLPMNNELLGGNDVVAGDNTSVTVRSTDVHQQGYMWSVLGPHVRLRGIVFDGAVNAAVLDPSNKVRFLRVFGAMSPTDLTLDSITSMNWPTLAISITAPPGGSINGLTVINSTFRDVGYSVFTIENADNVRFERNRFERWGQSAFGDAIGLDLVARKNWTIVDNVFIAGKHSGHAVAMSPTHTSGLIDNLVVRNNLFDSAGGNANGGAGISLQANHATMHHNVFKNGYSTGDVSWRCGIEFYGSDSTIRDNVIDNGTILVGSIPLAEARGVVVDYNIITWKNNNKTTACVLAGGGSGTPTPAVNELSILGNYCNLEEAGGADGISIGPVRGQEIKSLVVAANRIVGNSHTGAGVRVSGQCSLGEYDFAANKVSGNTDAVRLPVSMKAARLLSGAPTSAATMSNASKPLANAAQKSRYATVEDRLWSPGRYIDSALDGVANEVLQTNHNIVITKISGDIETPATKCASPGAVRLEERSSGKLLSSVDIKNGDRYFDSGPIKIPVSAGATVSATWVTPRSGCGAAPKGIGVHVEYTVN